MILVDTSVWLDHVHLPDRLLEWLIGRNLVLSDPFVIGEAAVGRFKTRVEVLASLLDLPAATLAEDPEVVRFITRNARFGIGIGYIDFHLLVSVKLTPGAILWTRDKRLAMVAEDIGVAFQP